MKTFTPKFFLSLIATTLIVSGIAYAATISGVISQTINTGDTMGQGWFQQINDKIIAVGSLAQSINTRVATLEGASSSAPSGTACGYATIIETSPDNGAPGSSYTVAQCQGYNVVTYDTQNWHMNQAIAACPPWYRAVKMPHTVYDGNDGIYVCYKN